MRADGFEFVRKITSQPHISIGRGYSYGVPPTLASIARSRQCQEKEHTYFQQEHGVRRGADGSKHTLPTCLASICCWR